MCKLLVVVVTCGVIVFAKLPPYIHKCSIKDPNINSCALNSARLAIPHIIKGDRKLKIPVLDPMFVPELRMASNDLEASALNSTLVGLKGIILETVGYDFEKKEATLQATVPSLNFTGSYRVSGKVASLGISGNGPYKSYFYNIAVQFKATYDLQKLDDGKEYMIFRNYDCELNPQNFVCRMENLFNGNKLLGEAMNNFVNENWRIIYSDTGKDISLAVGQIIFSILNGSAKTVPFKDIFNGVE